MDTTLSVRSIDQAVEEIMRIHRSLPARPGIDEVEASKALILNVDKEDQTRIEIISRQKKSPDVPELLFPILQEMQKTLVLFHGKDQKREALKLLELENVHSLFDEYIQRASRFLPSSSSSTSSSSTISSSSFTKSNKLPVSSSSDVYYSEQNPLMSKSSLYSDPIGVGAPQILDSSLKSIVSISGHEGDKLSLIKLAILIEFSAEKGTRDLDLHNKLMDKIEWLPDSIGKLSNLVSLDLSENRITTLPATIGGLSSLTKLELHSNRIAEVPESFGDLLNLVFLDLRANNLSSLPSTISRLVRLEELDLSSNSLTSTPESIGSLIRLKKLSIETNDLEELPHSIGHCCQLQELHAGYNKLKALPEAVGKIETLEVLSVRYNNIKQLPTTMSSLTNLKELDVSFNELESVPESLCFAVSLVKMNIGKNFADMQYLPRSIGNLENLEELDISNNQIRFLPVSFRMLTRLRVLRAKENPLEVPPRHIAEKGAQAVVLYMAELVEKRDVRTQPVKQKKSWA